jgi:hypothetical protein
MVRIYVLETDGSTAESGGEGGHDDGPESYLADAAVAPIRPQKSGDL